MPTRLFWRTGSISWLGAETITGIRTAPMGESGAGTAGVEGGGAEGIGDTDGATCSAQRRHEVMIVNFYSTDHGPSPYCPNEFPSRTPI